MAERKLKILVFVRGHLLKGRCEKCNAIFTTALVDDLKSAKAEIEADFKKHDCKP